MSARWTIPPSFAKNVINESQAVNERHTLSVAILSRSPDDVAFVNNALRDAGQAARCHQINNPEEFDRSLEDDSLELIFLSQEEYPDTIEQVVEQRDVFRPEIPLIALQKSLDEASIQAAIGAGASDLVSIENKLRLQAVVSRELRTLRMEKALSSTMSSATAYRRQLDGYMQSDTSAIACVDEGIIIDANNAWLNLFEIVEKNELIGLPLMDHFAIESQAAVRGALVATANGKWQQGELLSAKAVLGSSGLCDLQLELQLVNLHDVPHVQIRTSKSIAEDAQPATSVQHTPGKDRTTLLHDHNEIIKILRERLLKKPKSGLQVLVYIKPDRFSAVRKAVGGLNTDQILTQFAGAVCELLHPNDIAGRFEETVILALLERGNERDAVQWAKTLVKNIQAKVFNAGDRTITLTCTIGICAVSGAFSDLEELLNAVDDAHAQGRRNGGNTVFLDQVTEANARVLEYDEIWVRHIKSALVDNRFRLALLPIAGLRGKNAKMFDIFIRMIDEQGKEVLPSEFLPSAERNNLMNLIDRWVIKATINYCSKVVVERVFIRLSTQSIHNTTLVTWIGQKVENQKLDASSLCFQVPADDAAKYVQQTKDLADQLRLAGYCFALEHYGIDHHSHQNLDMLKPNYIKIDGELMHMLASDIKLQASVQKLVNAATERGIETVAERVENPATMAVLFHLGVHFMQGDYIHESEIVLQQA